MNYFDTGRPKVGDRPALLWKEKPVGAIPGVCFSPEADGSYSAEVCVVIAPSTGRWLRTSGIENATEFLDEYFSNPEEVLEAAFGWSYNAEARREPRSLSIHDLGDLE